MAKSTILAVLIGILMCSALSPGVLAQTDSPGTEADSGPNMILTLTLVPRTSGGEELDRPVTPATVITVAPGDTYLYQLSCENTGDAPARDFRVSIPIAKGEEYLANTASADSAVVSFLNSTTSATAETLRIKAEFFLGVRTDGEVNIITR